MLFSKTDIRKLMIPLVLEQLLTVAIGMIDTVMVASCGETAVSGVSLVDSINILILSMITALATGGAVVAAQYLGTKDTRHAGSAAKQLFYVVLAGSLVVMLFCTLLRHRLLALIFGSIEPEVMRHAEAYFLYTALSYPFFAAYSASAALLRAEGDSRGPLFISIVMNLINVTGNALLIYGAGLGAAGAAVATLASRAVGSVIIFPLLRRPRCVIPCPVLYHFEWKPGMIRRILRIAVPNSLENSLFQLGKLLLLSMVSTFGTVSIAANAVANTICNFEILPGSAVGMCMITIVGRCAGAHAFEQARSYTRTLMKMCYIGMIALNAIIILCTNWLMIPFNLSPETQSLARTLIILHGVGCMTLWPLSFTLPNALRAAGDTFFVMSVAVISMVVFRMVFGWLIGQVMGVGVLGVWIAMQIDWVCRIICFVLRYRGHRWETKTVV